MTHAGMVLLTLFANAAGLCFWLYWRERNERRRLQGEREADRVHIRSLERVIDSLEDELDAKASARARVT